MNIVKVRDIIIGEDEPKICVPIVGHNRKEILDEAKSIRKVQPDVAELRADCIDDIADCGGLEQMLTDLRHELGDIPLLFTLRSLNEGGQTEFSDDTYADINARAISSGQIDIIDVELLKGDEIVTYLIKAAHDAGIKVIASNHDFKATPDKTVIVNRFQHMQEVGADIAKIAVMPKTEEDVMILIDAARETSRFSDCPIIAISMGELGRISRTDCGRFGFAMTFASASKASAPGQIDITELRQLIQ